MANLPRPLIGLLVATIAFFAVWTVALRPSSSGGPVSSSSHPAPAATQPKPAATAHADAAAAASHAATATHASATRAKPVVKLAVPLSELSRYPVITNQVQVTESPTLVLIDGQRKADMLTGFLDQLELSQRVSDALAVK